MNHQHTEAPATPQGDGDPRPLTIGRIVQLSSDPRPFKPSDFAGMRYRVHTEKSGPAFLPMSVAEQLGASLIAQSQTTVGEVLSAIDRKCLLDLIAAWARLLKMNHITPAEQRRTCLRRDWFWGEALDAVAMALCYCETERALVRWHVADMLIRGEAAEAARLASKSLTEYEASPDGKDNADMLREHIATYRACAEGRA